MSEKHAALARLCPVCDGDGFGVVAVAGVVKWDSVLVGWLTELVPCVHFSVRKMIL